MTSPAVVLDGPQTRTQAPPQIQTQAVAASRGALIWLAALTPAVFALHGYHPYADDAGIYTAGIRKLADPSLYKPDAAFVLAHTQLSVFAHLLALVVRLAHMPLGLLLLLTHLASIYLFLFACWSLARRVFPSPIQRWCAVTATAAGFTLPIAGTALALMDPYVTARSFSTPLGLLALAAAIDRAWTRTILLLAAAALLHPLMTFYAAIFLFLFVLIDLERPRAAFAASILAIVAVGAIYTITLHTPVSPAYRQAVLSRDYLYPAQWSWIDLVGLFAPIALFAIAAMRLTTARLTGRLCTAATLLGAASTFSALLFVRGSGPYLLVRIQMLRSMHTLYALGLLLAAGFLGGLLFEHSPWQAFTLLAAVAAGMFFAQKAVYPLSAHIELPDTAARNPWQQAFLWIRANTPHDAVFAANPRLVFLEGEDAQGFRAISERSLLGDDKDEGVVVVFPALAEEWAAQRNAQIGLDRLTDSERAARLRPLGVTWLLLSSRSTTRLSCPYRNAVAQVCHLAP